MHVQTIDGFYSKARQLREVFDRRFADPLHTHPERFVWDYWHVPGEYTHLRTPAFHYFPKKLYEPFHRYLVSWGRENLGCHDISPPWLSCYVHGCRQQPHRDVPHGPLAFVYSLTPWQGRKFKGGETFIAKPKTLIEPKFNRLTIFNPSLTHGVREVKGTHDPREGRLVIHGWFVNPRPFWYGPFTPDDVQEAIDPAIPTIGSLWLGTGLISLRLKITPAGRVSALEVLVSTLVGARERSVLELLTLVKGLQFPRKSKGSQLTLPLMVGEEFS